MGNRVLAGTQESPVVGTEHSAPAPDQGITKRQRDSSQAPSGGWKILPTLGGEAGNVGYASSAAQGVILNSCGMATGI